MIIYEEIIVSLIVGTIFYELVSGVCNSCLRKSNKYSMSECGVDRGYPHG